MAELTWLTGRFDEARLGYRRAIVLAHDVDSLVCAQLHVALGAVESHTRSFAAARAEYEAEGVLLGGNIAHWDQATAEVWIGLMLRWAEL